MMRLALNCAVFLLACAVAQQQKDVAVLEGEDVTGLGESRGANNALFPSPSYCAPPDCQVVNASQPIPTVMSTPPAPGAGEEEGTEQATGAAPAFDRTAAPGLPSAASEEDSPAEGAPLSGQDGSGAPQYTNTSETAPLHQPPPPPEAEDLPEQRQSQAPPVVLTNQTEESTNFKQPVEQKARSPVLKTGGKLAPGCEPGETPNTPEGCQHNAHEKVHYPHMDQDTENPPARSMDMSLGEAYGGDYDAERKNNQRRTEEQAIQRERTPPTEKDTEHEDAHAALKARVDKAEKLAKVQVISHERGRKKSRNKQQADANKKAIDSQLQRARASIVPGEMPAAAAPLAEAASELDAKKQVRVTEAKSSSREQQEKDSQKHDKDEERDQTQRSVAFPDPGDKAPQDVEAEKHWNYDEHSDEKNKEYTIRAGYVKQQEELENERKKGDIVPGHKGGHSPMLPHQYAAAERQIKAQEAHYDRDAGKPVGLKAPTIIYKHRPGGDVVAEKAPPTGAPQYNVDDDAPPDEVHRTDTISPNPPVMPPQMSPSLS